MQSSPESVGAGCSGTTQTTYCSTDENSSCNERQCLSNPVMGSQNQTDPTSLEVESRDSKQSEENVTKQKSNIKVRLKYSNDDSREVNGLLHERLLDFKK